jgi:YggT family protein
MEIFQTFVVLLTQVLTFAIFARAILSWFSMGMDTTNPIVAVLYQITEPVLAPLRTIIPRIGMIDISPLVAMIVLQMIGAAVAGL